MSIHLSDLLDSICHDLDNIDPNSFIVVNSVRTIRGLTSKLKKSKTLFIRIQQMIFTFVMNYTVILVQTTSSNSYQGNCVNDTLMNHTK
ncbi:unnamed protein product [Oppiella nova]|uniref:Uncharacterized protein n=1 Tax=Oppiella nova TaxID=334625 RepID=A0A7R9ML99_9ACAR|nr:unnamed protein product [Oppiella nova]CAG2178269.1 unnamed protein product [Oppiella nova]